MAAARAAQATLLQAARGRQRPLSCDALRLLSSLVIVEGTPDGRVAAPTLSVVTAALQLKAPVTALVMGPADKSTQAVAEQAARVQGVNEVVVAQHAALAHHLPEPSSLVVRQLQEQRKFSHILCSSSSYGKNLLPRAAALLGVQPVADALAVEGPDEFQRPIYAGNAIATMRYKQPGLRMATVRATAFAPAALQDSAVAAVSPADAAVREAAAGASGYAPEWVRAESSESQRPDLGTARAVVCGGRALKSADNFALLERLADVLGGAVGASRAAVDAGYAPNDLQVGQTGKVVAPDLYVGVGISGAIQHLAGMKDSKTIVAINTDPEAPIFQVSDYYLVQDLFTAVPELTQELAKAKSQQK